MRDMPDESSDPPVIVVIADDEETPLEFVVDLVRSVFDHSDAQVRIFTETIAQQGRAGRHAASIPRPLPRRCCRRPGSASRRLATPW
jgi:hypothetical protein